MVVAMDMVLVVTAMVVAVIAMVLEVAMVVAIAMDITAATLARKYYRVSIILLYLCMSQFFLTHSLIH